MRCARATATASRRRTRAATTSSSSTISARRTGRAGRATASTASSTSASSSAASSSSRRTTTGARSPAESAARPRAASPPHARSPRRRARRLPRAHGRLIAGPVAAATGPNWLGSPQHFVVGAIAAAAAFAVARSRLFRLPEWLAVVLAVCLVSTAELVLELVRVRAPVRPIASTTPPTTTRSRT